MGKLLTILFILFAQYSNAETNLKVCFYNVENLFDTKDDPHTNDNDFLPSSDKKWNSYKYQEKLIHIGKAILATTDYETPDIIGLAEVENEKVLQDLIQLSSLRYHDYKYIHFDSKDPRGIDCALLYNPETIKILEDTFLRPGGNFRSRDILKATCIMKKDTFDIYVNHWSSRLGGKEQTEGKRMKMSKFLSSYIDSNGLYPPIIIGDFNDAPIDNSVQYISREQKLNIYTSDFHPQKPSLGSLKYKGRWNSFDIILMDQRLKKIKIRTGHQIDWLLIEDDRYGGKKPFRSWQGPRYLGGYSDHLPIYIEISL